MGEEIISLSWAELDSVTNFVERGLAAQGFPTILRLRTQMVIEEIFSAAMISPGAGEAKMRCSLPAPRTVRIQCRSADAGFAPDWSVLRTMAGSDVTYGLKLTEEKDGWSILVGEK